MQDIQSGNDPRNISINRVGIRQIRLPLTYVEGTDKLPTVGEWTAETSLSPDKRGTHMSRLVKFLHTHTQTFSFSQFSELPQKLKDSFYDCDAFLRVKFPRFIAKTAPASGEHGLIETTAQFFAQHLQHGGARAFMQISVPVTSLCPCSKTISDYGAHNQRSHITLTVEFTSPQVASSSALVKIAEDGASCELFSMLKRTDEKVVTERAYDNPKFVEDIVRDVALSLQQHNDILHYLVAAENFESIHNHSAYASITSDNFPTDFLTHFSD